MESLQIQILYCQYGWSTAQIAAAINKAETYVLAVIKENSLVPGSNLPAVQDGANEQETQIQALKANEITKQTMLAPLQAVAEIALLAKLTEAIDHTDSTLDDAGVKLANLVKAYKQLTQDSVMTKAVNEANDKPGIAIQVITQIA